MGKMSLWSCLHLFWVGDVGGKFIFVYLVVWDGEGAPWRGEFTPELARFICLFLVGSPRGTQLYVTHVIVLNSLKCHAHQGLITWAQANDLSTSIQLSPRFFRKPFVHIQENCCDFSLRRYVCTESFAYCTCSMVAELERTACLT